MSFLPNDAWVVVVLRYVTVVCPSMCLSLTTRVCVPLRRNINV